MQARLQQEEKDNWDWFGLQKNNFPKFKPTPSDQLVYDVGLFDGADTAWFLQQGFHVVAVDANPKFVDAAKEKFADAIEAGKLAIINAGLDDESGKNMTFYLADYLPHSSFEFDKACYTACQPMSIPVQQCQGLFAFGRPLYFKIDIEERHYTCVQALLNLQPQQLPKYISWEMHELALQQPFPLLDTQLILTSWKLGYTGIKIYENNGNEGSTGSGSFSGVLPEDTVDAMTHSTEWRTVQDVLQRGIPDARLLPMNGNSFSWWDFHMCLDDSLGNAA